ncbi:MAG: PRC-barrel domain-containing protein [Paracoccaceae bacterium]|nr:PRC-barrel domain-containing protein [Loktanella sp.]
MTRILSTLAIATSLAATPVLAQDVLVEEQTSSELRGDWVLGARVTSTQDEAIGSIEDLIISEEDGNIIAAVVSVGGFLGIGAKQIAVDWSELEMNWDANEVRLELSREEAEEADEYQYRNREYEPAPEATGTGTGMDTGTGMGTTGGDGL